LRYEVAKEMEEGPPKPPYRGDFKPPQAAVVKSHGSEHCGKGAQDALGVNQEGDH